MSGWRHLFVIWLALGGCTAILHAAPITQIVAFGDSLTDTGNAIGAFGGNPAYFDGRFSNGPMWVEYLASRLGVPAPTPSRNGGTNYAWGGATTEDGFTRNPLDPLNIFVPNIRRQVTDYLTANPRNAPNAPNPSQLFVLWGGSNDLIRAIEPAASVANLHVAITDLARRGGTNFLVPNIFKFGFAPLDGPFGQQVLMISTRDELNTRAREFNRLLAADLIHLEADLGITIHQLDANRLLREIRANPASFGFTNVTHSALHDGVTSGAGYLWFDDVHPTTAFHQLIANRAFGVVRPGPVLGPIVPEPSSLALVTASGCVLFGAARRRRSA